ncbi:hypothetical protein [Streptomyces yangpuensis]|uniref:hypothetical protein n=1 Tax=Streptomyces yangpuensis TaxID=1648182 RepID=UPI00062938B1|nr:hypothetical protein [Streptomyces yangpuensis]
METTFGPEFIKAYRGVWGVESETEDIHPSRDVAAWAGFTEECLSGYGDSLPEYNFELYVRDRLQKALDSPILQKQADYESFLAAVSTTDEDFRNATPVFIEVANPSALGWWHTRVPDKAGAEFADDVGSRFGVTINIV